MAKKTRNMPLIAGIGTAAMLTILVGLLIAFNLPSGKDDPLLDGVPATAQISDEEGDRLIDQAMAKWTAAIDQFSADLSDSSDALQEKRHSELEAVIYRASASYRNLLTEAACYFPDKPNDIYLDVISTRQMLQRKGVKANTGDILEGAVFLLKNSTYPEPNTEGIRSFDSQYQYWREKGLSHDDAIQKMFELEKF